MPLTPPRKAPFVPTTPRILRPVTRFRPGPRSAPSAQASSAPEGSAASASAQDTYLEAVAGGPGRTLARALGLPTPVALRRHEAGSPEISGIVLVLDVGASPGTSPDADAVARALLARGHEVHRRDDGLRSVDAVVLVLTELETPSGLTTPALGLGSVLRKLSGGGRVVTISRAAAGVAAGSALAVCSADLAGGADDRTPGNGGVRRDAARQGVVGFLRSVAHEMRAGATANGIVVADGVAADAPSVLGGLDYLLSRRSAFVSGQFLPVTTERGPGSLATAAAGERPLEGRVIVVTGAARGIGEQIARLLHAQGALVVPVDVPGSGDALARLANTLGGVSLPLDVTAADAGTRILAHCRTRHGRLDGIVHNAGITRDRMLANLDEARFASVQAVNLEAPLRITEQLLADPLNRGLRVVGLASTSGIAGNRGQSNYAASKAGVVGMVAALAPVLAHHGGTANAVAPGFIETEMTARMPAARRQVARRLNSLQQGGLPVDVAEAVAFLLSDGAAGISGQTLRVCGQNLVGA